MRRRPDLHKRRTLYSSGCLVTRARCQSRRDSVRWESLSFTLAVEPLRDSQFTVMVLADGTGACSERSSVSSAQVSVNDAGSYSLSSSLRRWARSEPCCGQYTVMDANMELTDLRTQAVSEHLRSQAGYGDFVVLRLYCNRHGLPGCADHLWTTGYEIPPNSDRGLGYDENANPSDKSAEQRSKECPCQCLASPYGHRSECWLQSW